MVLDARAAVSHGIAAPVRRTLVAVRSGKQPVPTNEEAPMEDACEPDR